MTTAGITRWIAVVLFSVHLAFCSRITLEENGYKGILVAIHRSVPEDEQLVNNLKTLFTDASRFLFSATEGKVYFKEITIAVPSNWTRKPEYLIQSGNHFSGADVLVDYPDPAYGDAPYTEQPGGCGEPGQYIHLTPRFVKEIDMMANIFGNAERQLVHEWAHFRYGVFDEYGVPGDQFYPPFYIDHNKVRPTSCTGKIPGWIRSNNGEKCCLLPNGRVNDDCMFVPDLSATTARASIMSTPFISFVDKFCDDGQHDYREHNARAPTRQNAMCNGRSTWNVVSSHEDFRNLKRTVPQSITPTFQVIQSPRRDKGTYVLVLDISHSMKGTPLTLLRQAATRLIEDRIPEGARLGIVQFGGEATILHPLTVVTSRTRRILTGNLPSRTISSTAIGKGLQKGVEVLMGGSTAPSGGLIILVSDGEENVSPYIRDVTPDIVKEGIVVNTIAFGTKASDKLERLTKATGGKVYFFSDLNGVKSTSGIDSAFLESVTLQSDVELQPQRLIEKVFPLRDEEVTKTIIIDSDLGKDTLFTVTSPNINKVDMRLRSPTGRIYEPGSIEYDRDVNRRERITVSLANAESGKWKIIFIRHGGVPFDVTLSITSKPTNSNVQPITVKAWLSDIEVKFPNRVKVYAEVRKGHRVVVGATVVSTVEGPTADVKRIVLRDNGAGADLIENDGIYSGYFTQFTSDGRYRVTADVLNDGKAKLKLNVKFSRSRAIPTVKGPFSENPAIEFPLSSLKPCAQKTSTDDENVVTGDPAPPFQRDADAGSFKCENWNPNLGDVIPPGEIRDLAVLDSQENYETKITEVTLQWTAVGDDLDFGRVASNELWVSTDLDSFLKDPTTGFRVPEKNITKGSLRPLSPGETQTVTVQVSFSDDTENLYFAVRAKDQADNISSGHSVAPVYISAKEVVAKKRNRLRVLKALVIFEDK